MADTVGSESAAIGAAGSTSRRDRGVQGERRIVTVLFCDVAGSTAMAEQLDPEEWAEIMQEAFAYMTGPVDRYEGNVARLMGDAILAFFGAPVAHEEDPQRAVLAGLDIIEGIAPFREEIREEYGLDFNLRVGINTGPVVVGDVGSEVGGEYTAMGDAVNVAARMEQTAKPGTVQISGETQKLIAPLFDFEALGVIEVKGKGEPVPAFSVLGNTAEFDPDKGTELSQQALALARELHDPSAEAKALWNLMLVQVYSTADNKIAVEYGEQSIAIAREHGLKRELAFALNDIARPYLILS